MSRISVGEAPAVRRRNNTRSEQSIRRLLDAAVRQLETSSYADLTVRSVAAQAGVSPATAYTYFPSKGKLIAEVYLRLLREAPVHVDVNETAEIRLKKQLRDLIMLVADAPNLADACTTAMMTDDEAVDGVRKEIAGEVGRRIASSLGTGFSRDVVDILQMLFSGAMIHARSMPGGYKRAAERADRGITLILHAIDDEKGERN